MRHTSNGIRCDKRTDLGMPTTLHSTLCRSHSSWMALAAALPPDRQSMLCFFSAAPLSNRHPRPQKQGPQWVSGSAGQPLMSPSLSPITSAVCGLQSQDRHSSEPLPPTTKSMLTPHRDSRCTIFFMSAPPREVPCQAAHGAVSWPAIGAWNSALRAGDRPAAASQALPSSAPLPRMSPGGLSGH